MEELKVAGETNQYIVIRLGHEQYGIDIRYIDNIVRMQHITRVPKMASYLRGVINLRGEVIPIMSMRLKMGLPADEETKATRIIIVKLEQFGTIGMIVDEVKEVVTLSEDAIDKPTSADSAGDSRIQYLSGIGKQADGLISLLNIANVVNDKEAVS